MVRRILMSLLVGAAVVALDRPDEASDLAEDARRTAKLCSTLPFLCRRAAEAAVEGAGLPIRAPAAYVESDANTGGSS